MSKASRSGLGDFLRSRRERLTPEAVGLPPGRRRRTPGLRREEVAELAGIGIDWYIRLEQGRTVRPSPATVEALAGALRLDDTERAHLRAMARQPEPRPFDREHVPDATRRLVENLSEPAYVTGRRRDLLAWNTAATELFTDFGRLPDEDRNVLVYLLLAPQARQLFGPGWTEHAKHAVAQFRTTYDQWAHDPGFNDLVKRLLDNCPQFAEWWNQHDVIGSGAGCKTLHHPTMGRQSYHYATFQANEDPALKLAIYTLTRQRGHSPTTTEPENHRQHRP
ncbi:helix-turn-helix transcriptional regulator [Kitasatospora sp. NPDC018058]|uniref:helix-turn-helix transcriptional regulator n=1 Tax=Kitasatospora sp. NPDC018058 TaxID=3364025 RepID=UPI0037BF5D74